MKFLIDENLPYYFSFWKGSDFIHVHDLQLGFQDDDIWDYAKQNSLVIVTKDADFSQKILFHDPPPKVIHVKIGNFKLKDLYTFFSRNWSEILKVSNQYKLVNVFKDRIEGIN
jgi:predicted nuclease of predicted toxin-antitoxin system